MSSQQYGDFISSNRLSSDQNKVFDSHAIANGIGITVSGTSNKLSAQ